MMRSGIVVTIFTLLFVPLMVSAETLTEFGVNSGFESNLFYDSTGIHDSYLSPFFKISYYPSSSFEISLSSAYTAYRQTVDLGSLTAAGRITFVHADDRSPFSFYVSGDLSARRFGTLYEDYNHIGTGVTAASHLRLSSRFYLKAGGAFSSNAYVNSESGDNLGAGIFGGFNVTPIGTNVFDVEAGLDRTEFTELSSVVNRGMSRPVGAADIENNLRTFYYSIRYSRPLADHTGISVEYAARSFLSDDNAATYGLSLDILSPWTSFWEGQALSAGLKSYLFPNLIVTSDFEYRDVTFMDALESSGLSGAEEFVLQSRSDRRTRVFLAIRRPFVLSSGWILTPSLSAAYAKNDSSIPMYDYRSFSCAVSVEAQW